MPDAGITTDIICGFPEETDEEFNETLEFVKKARFLKAHVFPYSERSGTVAAQMPQLPHAVREKRAAELIALTEQISREVEEDFAGGCEEVLFEQKKGDFIEGLSKNYLRIYVKTEEELIGEVRRVKIIEIKDGKLIGKMQS